MPGSRPTSAAVLRHACLFSSDLKRKQKRWQDGHLSYHTFNKRIVVHDERGNLIGSAHWRQDYEFGDGEELQLEQGCVIVQVAECIGKGEQDLTELIDKRIMEKEARHAKRQSTTNSSAGEESGAIVYVRHRPLTSILPSATPRPSHIPRAPAASRPLLSRVPPPQNVELDGSPRPAKRQRRDSPPPSKSGYARSLFGATLTLSATPISTPRAAPSEPLNDVTNHLPSGQIREQRLSSKVPNTLSPLPPPESHCSAPAADSKARPPRQSSPDRLDTSPRTESSMVKASARSSRKEKAKSRVRRLSPSATLPDEPDSACPNPRRSGNGGTILKPVILEDTPSPESLRATSVSIESHLKMKTGDTTKPKTLRKKDSLPVHKNVAMDLNTNLDDAAPKDTSITTRGDLSHDRVPQGPQTAGKPRNIEKNTAQQLEDSRLTNRTVLAPAAQAEQTSDPTRLRQGGPVAALRIKSTRKRGLLSVAKRPALENAVVEKARQRNEKTCFQSLGDEPSAGDGEDKEAAGCPRSRQKYSRRGIGQKDSALAQLTGTNKESSFKDWEGHDNEMNHCQATVHSRRNSDVVVELVTAGSRPQQVRSERTIEPLDPLQGPRLASLGRKSIRSREIIGYVRQPEAAAATKAVPSFKEREASDNPVLPASIDGNPWTREAFDLLGIDRPSR